jgi:hypothetical protein
LFCWSGTVYKMVSRAWMIWVGGWFYPIGSSFIIPLFPINPCLLTITSWNLKNKTSVKFVVPIQSEKRTSDLLSLLIRLFVVVDMYCIWSGERANHVQSLDKCQYSNHTFYIEYHKVTPADWLWQYFEPTRLKKQWLAEHVWEICLP